MAPSEDNFTKNNETKNPIHQHSDILANVGMLCVVLQIRQGVAYREAKLYSGETVGRDSQ